MKHEKYKIAATAVAAAFAVACFLSEIIPNKPYCTNKSSEKTDAESEFYRVAEFNGKIAVFTGQNSEPVYVFGSPYVRDLPEYDRLLLKDGITASSNRELLKILEDYDN